MKAPKYEQLFAQLALLNQPQRQQVLAALHAAGGPNWVVALIGEIRSKGRRCPNCGCERGHRHGQAHDLQRFRCCACGRTFNDPTGTPLARLRHKGKWLNYLETVPDSRTVRCAAKRVDVHSNTTFRWHHRFLDRLKDDRPERLVGIVEGDETFLLNHKRIRASSIASRASVAAGPHCAGSRITWIASWWRATAAAKPSTPSPAAAP